MPGALWFQVKPQTKESSVRKQQPPPQHQERRLTLDAAEAVFTQYDLPVPEGILRLWRELQALEDIHHHSCTDVSRLQQLEQELRIVETIEDELVKHVEQVLEQWQDKGQIPVAAAPHSCIGLGPGQEQRHHQHQVMQMQRQHQQEQRQQQRQCHQPQRQQEQQQLQQEQQQRQHERLLVAGGGQHVTAPNAGFQSMLGHNDPGHPTPLHEWPSVGDDTANNTLKSHLQALRGEDTRAVFIVRHINKLGLESPEHLGNYFSAYGQVKCVYVTRSFVRRSSSYSRLRPASLGFIVMSSPAATARIFADGPVHTIANVRVTVHEFQQRASSLSPRELDGEDLPTDLPRQGTQVQTSSMNSSGGYQPELQAAPPIAKASWDSGHSGTAPRNSSGGLRQETQDARAVAEAAKDPGTLFSGAMPLPYFLAGFSAQELYSAQPDAYED